jgi:hypothetical protein
MQAVGSCVYGATSRRGYALGIYFVGKTSILKLLTTVTVIARGYATSSGGITLVFEF